MTRPDRAPVAELRGAIKRYGRDTVLDALDLQVGPAEKLVLIGPSGSGKSTVLRLLMGLERLDGGGLQLFGEAIDESSRTGQARARHLRRRVGMVFQQFNLFPHLKVIDNLCLAPQQLLGLSREQAQARALALLERVGLADKPQAWPESLSGGQQQRVAIARALAMEPELMLFDEVTSALDPERTGEVLAVLRELAAGSSMSLLLVTHEMNFATEVADRVVFMEHGNVVEQGSPQQVLVEPQRERTRRFLGLG